MDYWYLFLTRSSLARNMWLDKITPARNKKYRMFKESITIRSPNGNYETNYDTHDQTY